MPELTKIFNADNA